MQQEGAAAGQELLLPVLRVLREPALRPLLLHRTPAGQVLREQVLLLPEPEEYTLPEALPEPEEYTLPEAAGRHPLAAALRSEASGSA